jgi:hypothetical protein
MPVENKTHLQAVTSIRFTVNHVDEVVIHLLRSVVSRSPVVTSAASAFGEEHILGVPEALVLRSEDTVDDLTANVSTHLSRAHKRNTRTLGSKSMRMARGM